MAAHAGVVSVLYYALLPRGLGSNSTPHLRAYRRWRGRAARVGESPLQSAERKQQGGMGPLCLEWGTKNDHNLAEEQCTGHRGTRWEQR